MEEEVVQKRNWVSKNHFLDLVGMTNLIPGPNAVEMALHIGYIVRGWRGLFLAGICFITPAIIISLSLAVIYVLLNTLPEIEPILFGIKPVIIAVIFVAIIRLGKTAVKNWLLLVLGLVIIPLVFFFDHYAILILFSGGIVGMITLQIREKLLAKKKVNENIANQTDQIDYEQQNETENQEQELELNKVELEISHEKKIPLKLYIDDQKTSNKNLILNTIVVVGVWGGLALALWLISYFYPDVKTIKLSFFFYGIGSILYGSGYLLIAYLREGLVLRYGWLTEHQLLDAVAIGQFTPGPLTSTVTVVGFLIDGYLGAFIATLVFYIPSIFLVIFVSPIISRLRKSTWTSAFLDAINISSIAIMLVTTLYLGETFVNTLDYWSIIVALVIMLCSAAILLKWKKINSAILIIAGAIIGGLMKYFVL